MATASTRRMPLSASASDVTTRVLSPRPLGDPDRPRAAFAPQQHVERTRTAVAGPCGREGEDDLRDAPVRQPGLEPLLQDRRAVLRVVSAAVHDQHAPATGPKALQ